MPLAAPTPSGNVGIVVGPDGAVLRRRLGPLAWCALETVVAVSDDQSIAAVSVRSMAVELGVSKNTAQRVLTTLRTAGFITSIPARRDGGRFSTGGYRVTIAASVLARAPTTVETPGTTVEQTPTRSRRSLRARVPPSVVEQLSLLPEV